MGGERGSERHYILREWTEICLCFENSQAVPACPSVKGASEIR
jgi:hypothetical protein